VMCAAVVMPTVFMMMGIPTAFLVIPTDTLKKMSITFTQTCRQSPYVVQQPD